MIYISLCICVLCIALLNNNVFVQVFEVHIPHMRQPIHWTSPMTVHQTSMMLLTLSFLMGKSWWKLLWPVWPRKLTTSAGACHSSLQPFQIRVRVMQFQRQCLRLQRPKTSLWITTGSHKRASRSRSAIWIYTWYKSIIHLS